MELGTPVSYWEELYRRYEVWIASFNAWPVIRLKITDYDLLENPHEIELIIDQIGNHFKTR